jgi:hypothetical protein
MNLKRNIMKKNILFIALIGMMWTNYSSGFVVRYIAGASSLFAGYVTGKKALENYEIEKKRELTQEELERKDTVTRPLGEVLFKLAKRVEDPDNRAFSARIEELTKKLELNEKKYKNTWSYGFPSLFFILAGLTILW